MKKERSEQRDTESHIRSLHQYFEPEKPLAKLFRTRSAGYLYDTGTNNIFQCREHVFELLNLLLTHETGEAVRAYTRRYGEEQFIDAAGEIIETIRDKNLLKINRRSRLRFADYLRDLESQLNASIQSVQLEVTEECNLRCRYCVYSRHVEDSRDFTPADMSDHIARKAIEFLERHSRKSEKAALGFYGGEPLRRFSFIKRCVDYAKEIIRDRELMFPITTNATLITPEIAEYLTAQDFSVLVSIDGPEDVHDRYRKNRNGKGSFKHTLAGLKLLEEKHRLIKKGFIAVSIVYTPPFSQAKLERINSFFKELDGLPDIYVKITYPNEKTIPAHLIPENGLVQDKDMNQWAFEKYRTGFENSDAVVKGVIEGNFARLMQRPVYTIPESGYSLNGCCIPGQKKCQVTVDGRFLLCEKITCNAPAIGHVDSGFDIDTIKRVYVDEYLEAGIDDCSACWGLRLCQVCYIMAYNAEGKLDMEKKRKNCRISLDGNERMLMELMSLMESVPEKLDYLYKKVLE